MVATGNFVASSNVALLQCLEDNILESLAPLLQVRAWPVSRTLDHPGSDKKFDFKNLLRA
ncbi:hypothetical protein NC652_032431 [Populus alba x Populus x berolinensis]|nr:hypothetical protein NC652_032431 [Populus alba x Populus x berolinensis]